MHDKEPYIQRCFMRDEIQKSLQVLKKGGLLLYPTDTVWGIGCDATCAAAVQKIYTLKQREESKALICLVSDFKMLKLFVQEIPLSVKTVLESCKKPTTVIYNHPVGVAANLIAGNHTLAIRICADEFCNTLIKKLGRPLVSTSANISGQPTPKSFQEISDEIKNGVDYIVNLHRNQTDKEPSTILKIEKDGSVKTIRA